MHLTIKMITVAIEAWEEFLALEPCVNRNDKRITLVKSEMEKMKMRISGLPHQ